MEYRPSNLSQPFPSQPFPPQSYASTPVNPTIHNTLFDAQSILAQVENLIETIDGKLFGYAPVATCDNVKQAQEPPVESLAIGLRTRLESLRNRLDQIQGRI